VNRLCHVLPTQNFKVVNILATGVLGYAVNLHTLAAEHPLWATVSGGRTFAVWHAVVCCGIACNC
jgi:hypothetical protein